MGKKKYTIAFAYAKDSTKELLPVVEQTVKDLNAVFADVAEIELRTWADATPARGIGEAQVLKQMNFLEIDYFVEVFRWLFGEPTGMKDPNGVPYRSGMEQEFDIAYRTKKRPGIALFRSSEPVPQEHLRKAAEDLPMMDDFFTQCQRNNTHPVLYKSFRSVEDFRASLFKTLSKEVIRACRPATGAQPDNYTDLFFQDRNDERNIRKIEQINKTAALRLSAKTGFSFLSQEGALRPYIYNALQRDLNFKLIVQDPWSFNALLAGIKAKDYSHLMQKKITAEELLAIYEAGSWYRHRRVGVFEGYETLRREFKGNISMKLSDSDMSISCLLSDDRVFLEPYFNSIQPGTKNLSLFEIMATSDQPLYGDTERDFSQLWRTSTPYPVFKKEEASRREKLRAYLEGLARG